MLVLGDSSIWRMSPGDMGEIGIGAEIRTFHTDTSIFITDNYLRGDSPEPLSLAIPAMEETIFPLRKLIYVRQVGQGQITLVLGSGISVASPATLSTRTQGSTIALVQIALGQWEVTGDLAVDCGC